MSENSNAAIAVRKNGKWFIGQGGGVKTYNDLADRPFYENVTYVGDTIKWDGEPTDIGVDIGDELMLYHISPATPRIEDLVGVVIKDSAEMMIELTAENFFKISQDCFLVVIGESEAMVVVSKNNYTAFECTFPESGIYAVAIEGVVYPVELKKTNGEFAIYDIKKIDKKYLPDSIVAVSILEASTIDLSQYPVGTIFVLYGEENSL